MDEQRKKKASRKAAEKEAKAAEKGLVDDTCADQGYTVQTGTQTSNLAAAEPEQEPWPEQHTQEDGSVFEGQWQQDTKSGNDVENWDNGSKYEGETVWQDGDGWQNGDAEDSWEEYGWQNGWQNGDAENAWDDDPWPIA